MKQLTIFISPVSLTSYFDVTLNKRNAGQGSVFCVWLLSCKDSMSLAVRKQFLRVMSSIDYDRTSNVFVDVHFGTKNHDFNFPLILDKYHTYNVCTSLKEYLLTPQLRKPLP